MRARRALNDGITLFGTTGEGPAFTVSERQGLLESILADDVRPDQCVVTISALAEAVSQVIAGINKGMKSGVDSDKLRLLLYHFPAMSTFGFSHALIAELVRRHGVQIAGVKDSSGELAPVLLGRQNLA